MRAFRAPVGGGVCVAPQKRQNAAHGIPPFQEWLLLPACPSRMTRAQRPLIAANMANMAARSPCARIPRRPKGGGGRSLAPPTHRFLARPCVAANRLGRRRAGKSCRVRPPPASIRIGGKTSTARHEPKLCIPPRGQRRSRADLRHQAPTPSASSGTGPSPPAWTAELSAVNGPHRPIRATVFQRSSND